VKGWLLDTNVIAEVRDARPHPRVEGWIGAQEEHLLFLSILTLGEYRKGIENLPPGDKRRPLLENTVRNVEERFSGRILPVSDTVVLRWGSISGQAKRITGHPPSVIDTLLAATAIEHHLYLATRNTADVMNSGAAIFNPWKDDPGRFPL
jgi:predicted nucleic acid-binding protein